MFSSPLICPVLVLITIFIKKATQIEQNSSRSNPPRRRLRKSTRLCVYTCRFNPVHALTAQVSSNVLSRGPRPHGRPQARYLTQVNYYIRIRSPVAQLRTSAANCNACKISLKVFETQLCQCDMLVKLWFNQIITCFKYYSTQWSVS